MSKTVSTIFLALLFLSSLSLNRLNAQTVVYAAGTVTGSMRVLNAITITTEQHLDFGQIFQNSTREITADSPEAAHLYVTKSADQGILIQVNYPSSLSNGPHSLSLTSGAQSAKYVAAGSSSAVYFNPLNYVSPSGVLSSVPSFHVCFGGALSPTLSTRPGGYQGVITVSVSYTGI